MNLFDESIRKILEASADNLFGTIRSEQSENLSDWPPAGNRDIVLKSNTGKELGSPDSESFSLAIWTNRRGLITDGRITLAGPDIGESEAAKLPFGKIVLIGGDDFDETNAYERYRQLSLVPYEISLRGYMIRTASHYMKEWIRISRDAVNSGFSVFTAGNALIKEYRKRDYVKGVEILLITETPEAVKKLRKTCEQPMQILNAMRKMAEEMSFDCDTCEYQDVCGEIEALRAMMEELEKRKTA